ncbi:hypothetical protein KQH81_00385 [Clostridium cadaveris]|uniref:hypothetical protein n=1 Tax=Clostridium cadaveris TaxID=1529 RepID=UPI001E33B89F|nr:hypothetical protein [Clostridium cadaveris]UFH65069.1 hypothetical protein KQH81_00385 [Clostridium cadaveris]
MKNKVLEFDKRNVRIEEIKEHVKFYIDKSNDGFKLLSDGNKKDAMEVLKEIRDIMKLENKYYNKSKLEDVILSKKEYNNYCSALRDILAHQINTNSYDNLSSNLYDIEDYMMYYCADIL